MRDPLQVLTAALNRGGFDPRPTGPESWESRCPGHDGDRHNLTISRGDDGRVLIHCHHADDAGRGCDPAAILGPLGMTVADLFPEEPGRNGIARPKPKRPAKVHKSFEAAVAAIEWGMRQKEKTWAFRKSWTYREGGGAESFRVARFENEAGEKDYRPLHPTPEGWAIGDPPGPLPLYRLAELADAHRVFVLEGEKCADLARDQGLTATTSAHGAKSAGKTDWTPLAGKEVIIVPDAGQAGAGYAQAVAGMLAELEPRPIIKVVRLTVEEDGDDIEQWLEDGVPEGWGPEECRAELERLAGEAHPGEGFGGFGGSPGVGRGEINGEAGEGFGGFGGSPGVRSPEFAGPPRPIMAILQAVPALDAGMLPGPLRGWIVDIADRMQCALEFPAVAALIALATVVGRKVGIRPKRKDTWTVVPNLWGLIIGRPGVLKSPGMQEAMRPLDRLIAEAQKRHAADVERSNVEMLIAGVKKEAAAKALKDAARKKTITETELIELAEAAITGEGPKTPALRRYKTNDPTVESLGELLRDNPNGILLHRDEVLGFLRTMDQQGHEHYRAFYLEGWNGTGSFTVDRISRGSVQVEAMCISLVGGIQPGPLASYIRSASTASGDDGLIARFQLAVYPDQDREFRIVDRWPETEAKNRAFGIYKALDELQAADVGAEEGEEGDIPFLRFEEEAQAFFYSWWEELEVTKLRAQESPAIESHLAKYRSLMPSLALLFHLVDLVNAGSGTGGPVSLAAARRAAGWCAFLEGHARRIYWHANDGDIGPAQLLAERIKQSLPEAFTAAEVSKKGWKDLSRTEDAERALGILEEHGWVRPVEAPPGAKGGRPTVRYHINPLSR